MLTIKQITDDKEGVIRGLEKSTFQMQKKSLMPSWKQTIVEKDTSGFGQYAFFY